MMRNVERLLYRWIVRMHPTAFRDEFGREMLLDFEGSVAQLGFTGVCLDALRSVVRQWAWCALSGDADRICEAQPSLLAGEYAPVHDEPLNGFELSRGLLASLLLLTVCGYALGNRPGRQHPDTVYAAAHGTDVAGASAPGQAGGSSASGTPHVEFTAFDVVTVRESRNPGPPHVNFPMTNDDYYVPTRGYLQISNMPLLAIIQFAYRMNAPEVVAFQKQLPDWAVSTRYDIEARVDGNPGKNDMRTMVRALLADRFRLRLHTETRIDKVYDLVLAKPGQIGRSLHLHESDGAGCAQESPEGFHNPCGTIAQMSSAPGAMRMVGRNVSLTQFVFSSSPKVDRTLVDKTGLAGKYDFTLEYVPERIGSGPDINASEPPASPTFSEAIQEQMGLKLVPNKGPVQTYLLDHVERPTEN
jgi:uncharacterized protein (TIGR03435 family)